VIEGAATLLERERELGALGHALTEAALGHGQVVLVEASAGLGKTSLLRAAADGAAEEGFSCLRARATELERDFAYGCVRQLFEPSVASLTIPDRERLFDGAARLSQPLFAPTGAELTSLSADRSYSMLHGLYWLLNNLADSGRVVLIVDDLHWSDVESLRLLNYLSPRLDGLPVVVLASARSGEKPTELGRLAASPDTTVLRPVPLSVEATATLCARRLGASVEPDFAAACREATGGNPFFLEALLREAIEQGISTSSVDAARVHRMAPVAVTDTVLLRLSGAPAAARVLVRAVAVLGDGASISEAAAMAQLSVDEVAAAADRLVALDILRSDKHLEFAHPIVREAVCADIGPRALAVAHARAVRILEARVASEERIAAQIADADPSGDASWVERLRRVAEDAVERGAPGAAVAWLGRALAEPPPPESRAAVLLELGSAEVRLGASGAVAHLGEAVELLRDPEQLATAVRRLAIALTLAGNAEAAVAAIEAAVEVVEREDRELALGLEGEALTHAIQASLETRARIARRLERHAALEGSTPGQRLVVASLACVRARDSETAQQAAALLEGALADGRFVDDQRAGVVGLGLSFDLVLGLIAADALDVADAYIERTLVNARAQVAIPSVAYLTARRGCVALRRGSVAQAEADARTALELLTAQRVSLGVPFALGVLIGALIDGAEDETAELELRLLGFDQQIPPGPTSTFLLEARGMLHLARGRTDEGLEDLLEFGRRDELWGIGSPLASCWRSHVAAALAVMGRGEEAWRMASDDLERARRWGAASGIGVALRAVALSDPHSDPVVRLREAVNVLAASPARLEHARALTDLGAALRRANRRAEARTALEEALDLATRCGGRVLATRVRTELRAAGGRSAGPEIGGINALTASERRVAELAAEGHSNPEIAQTLYVTRKTVETHLGHVYRKLGVTGRGKLARVLSGQP
jgi:DNA-binding CsgD family transcriptional regulator